MSEKNFVTYLDFGAKGDGVTDDFGAIVAAHEYANEALPQLTSVRIIALLASPSIRVSWI